jgi:hypothetical protein
MLIVAYPCRVAADIAQAAAASSLWVPCFGARAVIFEWKATNATALQNGGTPVEASNADPLVTAGSAWSGTPGNLANPTPNVATFALNGAQGGLRCTVTPSNSMPFIANRAIRMNVLGSAASGTTTGVSCIAYVVYDGEMAPTIVGQQAI